MRFVKKVISQLHQTDTNFLHVYIRGVILSLIRKNPLSLACINSSFRHKIYKTRFLYFIYPVPDSNRQIQNGGIDKKPYYLSNSLWTL